MACLVFISWALILTLHGTQGAICAETTLPHRRFAAAGMKRQVEKGGSGAGHLPLTLGVHKRCAWRVDNHVDKRPMPCRTTAPHRLPNRWAAQSLQFHQDAVFSEMLAWEKEADSE